MHVLIAHAGNEIQILSIASVNPQHLSNRGPDFGLAIKRLRLLNNYMLFVIVNFVALDLRLTLLGECVNRVDPIDLSPPLVPPMIFLYRT